MLKNLTANLAHWIARHLPETIRYWVSVDLFAKATTGEYGETVSGDLTVFEMQERCFK